MFKVSQSIVDVTIMQVYREDTLEYWEFRLRVTRRTCDAVLVLYQKMVKTANPTQPPYLCDTYYRCQPGMAKINPLIYMDAMRAVLEMAAKKLQLNGVGAGGLTATRLTPASKFPLLPVKSDPEATPKPPKPKRPPLKWQPMSPEDQASYDRAMAGTGTVEDPALRNVPKDRRKASKVAH